MVQKIQSDGVVSIGIPGTYNKIDVIAPEQLYVSQQKSAFAAA